jgi:multiple sugar transport system ATP-binding protein
MRVSPRAQIKNLHRELKATTIFVTNVQIEAMVLGFRVEASRIAKDGEIAAPVYSMELLGDASMATVQVGGALVAIKAAKDFMASIGQPIAAHVPGRICHLFDAATGARIERP